MAAPYVLPRPRARKLHRNRPVQLRASPGQGHSTVGAAVKDGERRVGVGFGASEDGVGCVDDTPVCDFEGSAWI
jgi:hypothetical protein